MARGSLGLLACLSVACVRPATVDWPTRDHGQAIVSALWPPPAGSDVTSAWAGLPSGDAPLTVTNDRAWLIIEYEQSFEALQLEPQILPMDKVTTPSAGLSLGAEGLPPPERSWRAGHQGGEVSAFTEGPPGVLPAELYDLWARDLACPQFEAELKLLPAPLRILLPLDGASALGVSADGRHYLISARQILPLIVEGWPGGQAALGGALGPADFALATVDGALARGHVAGRAVRYQAPIHPLGVGGLTEIRAVTGAPSGDPLVVSGAHGQVAVIRGQTSTVVHDLFVDPEASVDHQRLAWIDSGEVLGLYRQAGLGLKGVWRLTLEGTPQVRSESFGTSTLDSPNEIARIQGEWTIAGSHNDLRDRQHLFRDRGRGWELYTSFLATRRIEAVVDAPSWDGVVFATRDGARIGAQARLGHGRPCPEVLYRPQEIGRGDVVGLITLSDGRVLAALENLDQLLILRPHRPWLSP